MTLITKTCTQPLCRLKKVQAKKKRDAEKAEAERKIIEDAAGETGDEAETEEASSTTGPTGDLLKDKDEDVIF